MRHNDGGITSWAKLTTPVSGHMVHWIYDLDENECFFVDFLLCAEIGVIYITDVFGFSRHVSLSTRGIDMNTLRMENAHSAYVLYSLRLVLTRMFNGFYEVLIYDGVKFHNDTNQIIKTTKDALLMMAPVVLPTLVEDHILQYAVPEWCRFLYVPNASKHIQTGRDIAEHSDDPINDLYEMALEAMGVISFHALESMHTQNEFMFHTCVSAQKLTGSPRSSVDLKGLPPNSKHLMVT